MRARGVRAGDPDPMRILLVSDHYPPFIGGAHVQTRLIARGMAARGHDVAVAAPWQRGVPEHESDGAVTIHRLRQLRTLRTASVPVGVQQHQPPFADPVTTVALRRLIGRFQPDLVHSHGWIGYACAAALTRTDVPLLLSSRDYGYTCPKRTLLYDGTACTGPALTKCGRCAAAHYGHTKGWLATAGVFGSRQLLRSRATAVHSVSRYVRDVIRRDFIPEPDEASTRWVIPEAVPDAEPLTADVAADLALLPTEPFILFVGALRREKGIAQLLTAYQRLDEPPPLVLIGTLEPDTPSDFPRGAVVLRDFRHASVLRAWDHALFGVFPSMLPEPMGTAVCEAVTRGRPVIGTTPGGHVDVIEHEVNGLLVPQGDIEALAAAMQRLLADGELRGRLGRAAAESSDRFGVGRVLNLFEELYMETITCR